MADNEIIITLSATGAAKVTIDGVTKSLKDFNFRQHLLCTSARGSCETSCMKEHEFSQIFGD